MMIDFKYFQSGVNKYMSYYDKDKNVSILDSGTYIAYKLIRFSFRTTQLLKLFDKYSEDNNSILYITKLYGVNNFYIIQHFILNKKPLFRSSYIDILSKILFNYESYKVNNYITPSNIRDSYNLPLFTIKFIFDKNSFIDIQYNKNKAEAFINWLELKFKYFDEIEDNMFNFDVVHKINFINEENTIEYTPFVKVYSKDSYKEIDLDNLYNLKSSDIKNLNINKKYIYLLDKINDNNINFDNEMYKEFYMKYFKSKLSYLLFKDLIKKYYKKFKIDKNKLNKGDYIYD